MSVLGSRVRIAHRLADLATEIETSRLLVYDVAEPGELTRTPGQLLPRKASMAKLKATEVDEAHGARGDADDGRIRLRHPVRHGAPRPYHAAGDDLRRHERDPARRRRQDAGLVERPVWAVAAGLALAPPRRA